MRNPLKQLSPRISASFAINKHLSLNANTGIYYQLPAYTIMGYRDNNGVPVNMESGLRYIRNDHLVAGMEWASSKNSRITLEGFYKCYHYYPFSLRYEINLANLGSDFGVIGNEPVRSTGRGRAYGIELMAQQKLFKGFYGIAAYTLSWSEFTDKNNLYVPSSWDTRNILNLVAGKRYKRNWETGINFRFQTGLPITPYDYDRSALVANWDINPAPL